MKLQFRRFVLGFLLLYSQRTQAQQSFDATIARRNDAIPFQLAHDYLILVEGRVGPLTRLKFILDTGTTHTTVDKTIADKLSLRSKRGNVLNFDKYVNVEWTTLPEVQVGPLHALDVQVMVGDLKQISEFAEGVDAIVGLDLLRTSQTLRIDYRKSVVIFRSSSCGPVKPQVERALTVRLPVQAQSMRLIIDTGLHGLLLYQDRLRRHQLQLKLSGKIPQAFVGRLKGQIATLSGIQLGADELQSSVLLLPAAPKSLPPDIDGYFGTNTLRAQVIELDFACNTLRWQ